MGSRRIVLVGEKGDGTETVTECDISNIIGVSELSYDENIKSIIFKEDGVSKTLDISSILDKISFQETSDPIITEEDSLPTVVIGDNNSLLGGCDMFISLTTKDGLKGKIPFYLDEGDD